MAYSVATLKADLAASLHGTTINRVQSVSQLINRSASQILFDLDPQETKRTVALTSPIYNSVYTYYLPVDLKGNKVIDLFPQANRTLMDRYPQVYNQDFSLFKRLANSPMFSMNFNGGLKTINIENNLIASGLSLNSVETIAGNGTWAVSGGGASLRQDNVVFVDGTTSSLAFNITGTQAILTNSTSTAIDCSGQNNQSQILFFTYLPTASDFTSVQIKWGSSSGNYWTQTLTTTQSGTVFQDGWNLLSADWGTATQVGSPNNASITYLQVTWNYASTTQTGVRLNSIYSRLGVLSNIEYYSKYMFRDNSTGAFKENTTSDSDLINLDTETRNLFFYKTGEFAVQQIQGLDATFFDANFFGEKYQEGLFRYKQMYKSEVQKPQSTYYDTPSSSYRRYFGTRNW